MIKSVQPLTFICIDDLDKPSLFNHPKQWIDFFSRKPEYKERALLKGSDTQKLHIATFAFAYLSLPQQLEKIFFQTCCTKPNEKGIDLLIKYKVIDKLDVTTLATSFFECLCERTYVIAHKIFPFLAKRKKELSHLPKEVITSLIGYSYRFNHFKMTSYLWQKYDRHIVMNNKAHGLGNIAFSLFQRTVLNKQEALVRTLLRSSHCPSSQEFGSAYQSLFFGKKALNSQKGLLRAFVNHRFFPIIDVDSLFVHLEFKTEKDLLDLTEIISNSHNNMRTKKAHFGLLLKIAGKKGYLGLVQKIVWHPLFPYLLEADKVRCFRNMRIFSHIPSIEESLKEKGIYNQCSHFYIESYN